jgi:hypothetical protein
VEVLPTLEAAQLRRHRLTRRAELEDKAHRLQILINQRHRKSDVASLKSILAELRQLRQLDIVDDMPGIEDAARRIADERVTAIRGVVGFQALTEEELLEELTKRGLPRMLLEE